LLGLVPLHRHDRFSSKWILSHSTWYKNGRSRQFARRTGIDRHKDANTWSHQTSIQNP
jgi:hypothetical protein